MGGDNRDTKSDAGEWNEKFYYASNMLFECHHG